VVVEVRNSDGEVVKTRSAFLHALDQSLSEPVVYEIIEASEKSAGKTAA